MARAELLLPLPLEVVPEEPEVDMMTAAAVPEALEVGMMTAPATMAYSGDITRGEVCAFMPGYFDFLPETRVSVASVLHFMPGMKVGIATNPMDFHVFNR